MLSFKAIENDNFSPAICENSRDFDDFGDWRYLQMNAMLLLSPNNTHCTVEFGFMKAFQCVSLTRFFFTEIFLFFFVLVRRTKFVANRFDRFEKKIVKLYQTRKISTLFFEQRNNNDVALVIWLWNDLVW